MASSPSAVRCPQAAPLCCRRATRRRLSIASPLTLLWALFPFDALLPAAAEVVAAGGGASVAADAAALPSHDFEASLRSERERKREETALRRKLPALTRLARCHKWIGTVRAARARAAYLNALPGRRAG